MSPISKFSQYNNNTRNMKFIPVNPNLPAILKSARQEFELGNYDIAANICLQFLRRDRYNTEVLLLLSSIYFESRDLDKSTQCSTMALRQDPLLAEAYSNLGNVYKERGQLQEAIRQYRTALHLKPGFVDGYVNLGVALVAAGQIGEAIEIYGTLLQYEPSLHCVRNDLGTLLKSIGKFEEAKECYIRIIEDNPGYAIAWCNLGCTYEAEGEVWLAIHYLTKAVELNPNLTEAFINLGNVLTEMELFVQAVSAYQSALNLTPDNHSIHCRLAFIYKKQGLIDAATESYRLAVKLEPNTKIICELVELLKAKDQLQEAEYWCNMGLKVSPKDAKLFYELGDINRKLGYPMEAIRFYKKAIEVFPRFTEAYAELATELLNQKNYMGALILCEEAIQIDPNLPKAYFNLGNALVGLNERKEAVECYKRAIEIKPLFAGAHFKLAHIYRYLKRLEEAVNQYRRALELKPNATYSYCQLHRCALRICDWVDYNTRTRNVMHIVAKQLLRGKYPSIYYPDSYLLPFSHNQRISIATSYANKILKRVQSLGKPVFEYDLNLTGRLKIGYVLNEFRVLDSTIELIRGIPVLHDRKHFEIFCYALFPNDGSPFYEDLAHESEHFVDLSYTVSYWEAANRIHSDGIHILVNIDGYPFGKKKELFALKPAPIQTMWLGYSGTSGASFIDYIITDELTSPLSYAHSYTEKLAYLPHTFYTADYKRMFPHLMKRLIVQDAFESNGDKGISTVAVLNAVDLQPLIETLDIMEIGEVVGSGDTVELLWKVVDLRTDQIQNMITNQDTETVVNGITIQNGRDVSSNKKIGRGEQVPHNIIVTARHQYSLPEDAIVFCNFCKPLKQNPTNMQSWVNILKRVPNSILWLVRHSIPAEKNLREFVSGLGISEDRLIFSDRAKKEEHIRRGQLADVCLDTVLYNGHLNTMQMIWAGTPVVAFLGDTYMSRMTAGILTTLGCPELIARTREEYEEIAVRLGTDQNFLKTMRHKVWNGRLQTPLFDGQRIVTDLEKLYENMWLRFRQKKRPDHIKLS